MGGKVELIVEAWQIVTGLGGTILSLVVWFLRLEGLGKQNSREIEHMVARQDNQEKAFMMFKDKVTEELGDIKTMLARILAKMENK
jgi:hypothetical protein